MHCFRVRLRNSNMCCMSYFVLRMNIVSNIIKRYTFHTLTQSLSTTLRNLSAVTTPGLIQCNGGTHTVQQKRTPAVPGKSSTPIKFISVIFQQQNFEFENLNRNLSLLSLKTKYSVQTRSMLLSPFPFVVKPVPSIAKDPSGLDSDLWIPLRGGARIPRGQRDSRNTSSAGFTDLNPARGVFRINPTPGS